MKTVLLTGASGFTGRVMQRFLEAKGMHVLPLHADITDPKALEVALSGCAVDWVIHLAALSFVAEKDLSAYYRVNVMGTLNVLEALERTHQTPERILIASTAHVYGIPSVSKVNETVLPAPVNHYACSKMSMEYLLAPWFDRFSIIVTRPFNYTGVGQHQKFVLPKIVQHFAVQAPTIALGNLHVRREFSDVDDVVEAYERLLNTSASGIKVNICSGRAYALTEILEMMADIAGYEIDVKVDPAFVRAQDMPLLCGDPSLLHELTGFVFQRPLKATLHRMFEAAKRALYV